ncbi:hypothetical protein BS78_01G194400 [Paspalum vaginatum]|uniref:BTB domain-containing protein n=1 Tax=Paspalum vaginatum TaxID=158149 RepID=A0A9W7XBJ3_9POAL|nr:hypothetical protein BS78_K188700 [Paspalum vaginatum]KAJ1255543.1 hypothetical protein BS78_K188900 [Paspalum vaginatum]KAJ1295054.1 hypothetical protein BS78_01G194300 [Paspalum vaginatum]KAJ1295055.1 hypothetical protein BS78_01G194400 [Paspalum vaginatum]
MPAAGGAVTRYLLHIDRSSSSDEMIEIPSFNVGDCYWRISCYPRGCPRLSTSTDRMSINLTLDGRVTKPIKAQVKVMITLLDQDGEPVPGYSVCTDIRDYSKVGDSYGYDDFLIHKEILESANCFTVACDVFVYRESPLSDDLRQELMDADADDVVLFQVGGETFGAHRCVLAARSPLLEAELYKGTTAGASCTQIDNMLPLVFANLLCFVYTDFLPYMAGVEEPMMAEHLLAAADRFGMEELKLVCEEKLFRELNHDTAAKILKLAVRHRSSFLREACIGFLQDAPCLEAAMAMDDGLCEHVAKFYPVLLKNMWIYEEDDELAMCL